MDSFEKKIGSIRTKLLVAYIFAILTLVLLVAGLVGISVVLIYTSTFVPLGIIYLVDLVWMIPSILVMIRTRRMYKAAKSNDVKTLKELNSIGWAIVALIFTSIITGIMLLIVHRSIATL